MEKKKSDDVNSKWDACLDLTARRVVYSSLGGAFAGLLFFRSPVTRWASIAFGAGLGIGSAYTDCSRVFDASSSSSASAALVAPISRGRVRERGVLRMNPNIDDGSSIAPTARWMTGLDSGAVLFSDSGRRLLFLMGRVDDLRWAEL
ncbi:unnamed protein product [Brassica rapa subsp. trilocularis]|uniref:MICOS complex subunit MIC10 n=3 Tax=Brassica TaxID=3705 RepID=M4DIP9_BRACM|nr:unnamed protein product [Brassica napus]CDY41478.1 BnaA08g20800D [Brassica napus]